jgi:hypothetical protein
MRNLIFSVFAIGVAAVAAMTATTAMLNTPVPRSSAVVMQNLQAEAPPAAPAEDKSATPSSAPPATPAAPGASADGAAKPASGAPNSDTKAATDEEEVDKDPYEGIAAEELPPDLQYNADSSVSFPTNI